MRNESILASIGVTLALACAAEPARPLVQPPPVEPAAPVVKAAPPPADPRETVVLGAALHHATITEVNLDPRGEAAVTLDASGGARLWPDIRGGAATLPIVLPFEEATWVSLARAGERSFMVAALDTAGGARVGRIEIDKEGVRWRTILERPPTEPTLELHVFDGGARLLALSLDHRLTLHDGDGALLSELDLPGFIPWQLRVAQPVGKPPTVVAVLASPTRVQPIALAGDRLALAGEARRVDLDQGPNHNDLALAPDGTYVTSLRRPKAKGKGWSLELVDLATDARRFIAGEVDQPIRPRLHLVEPGRALLESGSGKGFWIDLAAAQAAAPGVAVDRKTLPPTRAEVVDLPGSTVDSRMFAAIAAGVRAVPQAHALLVDPLAEAEHLRYEAEPLTPRRVALDPSGSRVVWYSGGKVYADAPGAAAPKRIAEPPVLAELAFLDRERLFLGPPDDELTIRRFDDGAILGGARFGKRERVQLYVTGDGRGRVIVREKDRTPLVLPIEAGEFAAQRAVTAAELVEWPELKDMSGEHRRLEAEQRAATGEPSLRLSHFVEAGDRTYALARGRVTRVIEARAGQVRSHELFVGILPVLALAPGAARVAVASNELEANVASVAVIDFGGDAPRLLWTRGFVAFEPPVAWSADGTRLAVGGDAGWIFDALTGEVLLERRDLGLVVRRAPDAGPAL
jgi:hypothetical protein